MLNRLVSPFLENKDELRCVWILVFSDIASKTPKTHWLFNVILILSYKNEYGLVDHWFFTPIRLTCRLHTWDYYEQIRGIYSFIL